MISTFYSYKGGVGRSQLVANLAAYFCYYEDKKILLIDWDLEAPGLHFYFEPTKTTQQQGLIELLSAYCQFMEQRQEDIPEEDIINRLRTNSDEETLALHRYIIPQIVHSPTQQGYISLMTAGAYNDSYTETVNNFDWTKFYENLNGGYFLELLKKQLKSSDYDYIFIDSRTGISDYSGICNIQMPDVNILLVAPSEQNLVGTENVIKRIQTAPYIQTYHKRFPIVLPILSRLDPRDDSEKSRWIRSFREKFRESIAELIRMAYHNLNLTTANLSHNVDAYLDNTLLEYRTDLSYGERIIFDTNLVRFERNTLAYQIANIAQLLAAFKYYPSINVAEITITAGRNLPLPNTQRIETALQAHWDKEKNLVLAIARAVFYQEQKNYDQALKAYQDAEAMTTALDPLCLIHNNQAIIQQQIGNTDAAKTLWERTIAQHPQRNEPLLNYANFLREQNQLPEAMIYYNKAFERYSAWAEKNPFQYLLPKAQVLENRAYTHLLQNNTQAAIEDYTELLALYLYKIDNTPDSIDDAIVAAYNNLAYAQLQQKQYEPALENTTKAIEKRNTDNATTRYLRAQIYITQQNFDAAVKECSTIIADKHTDIVAHYWRAVAYIGLNDYKQATNDCADAINYIDEVKTKHFLTVPAKLKADLYKVKALAYKNDNGINPAIGYYRKALDLVPNDSETQIALGLAYYYEEKYDKALDCFNIAIQQDNKAAYAYCGKALLNMQQKDTITAMENLNKAIALMPNEGTFYIERGNIFNKEKKYAKAIADYSQAISLAPQQKEILHYRAVAYKNNNNLDAAIADYNAIITADCNDAKLYKERADIYYRQSKWQQAIDDYSKAIEHQLKDKEVYKNRAWCYNNLGNRAAAWADCEIAISMDENFASAYNVQGAIYHDQGDYEKAIAAYTITIGLDPQHQWAYYNRGIAYRQLQRYAEAIKDYTKAIKINANYVNAYNNRASVYKEQKNYSKAIADYNKVIKFAPFHEYAYSNRAELYHKQENYAKAIQDYEKALSILPADNNRRAGIEQKLTKARNKMPL